MELFRATRRRPPRYIPVVGLYDRIPDEAQGLSAPARTMRNQLGQAASAAFIVVALLAVWQREWIVAVVNPDAAATPAATASIASPTVISPPAAGPGTPDAAVAVRVIPAEEALMQQVAVTVNSAHGHPTTPENLPARLQLLEKFFKTLDANQRLMYFGFVDFRDVEAMVKQQGPKGFRLVDRILLKLQLRPGSKG